MSPFDFTIGKRRQQQKMDEAAIAPEILPMRNRVVYSTRRRSLVTSAPCHAATSLTYDVMNGRATSTRVSRRACRGVEEEELNLCDTRCIRSV